MQKSNVIPDISVIMPAHNSEAYIAEAVQSILEQTWQNFELIIINDGSTDYTLQVVESFTDSRIRVISLAKNGGISAALNTGITQARGHYIARLDSDDISDKHRLQKQKYFLDQHPEVGVIGCYIKVFDHNSERIHYYPLDSLILKKSLPYVSPFAHPAVMIRKSCLPPQPYNSRFNLAEDLDLWFRLSTDTEFATLPECLIRLRRHSSSSTQKNLKSTFMTATKVRWRYRHIVPWTTFTYFHIAASYLLVSILPAKAVSFLFDCSKRRPKTHNL